MTDSSVNLEEHVNSITTTLLNEAKRGEQRAWHRLIDVYLPLVYRWCQQQGLQQADVLDVGQDVLQRVSNSLGKFRRERSEDTFRGWLRQITRNAILDHYRKQQKQFMARGGSSAQELLATTPSPKFDDSDDAQMDEVQILYSRLVAFVRSEFSEQDWQAFYKVTVERCTAAEVAELLGISRNQVYLAKSRIQKRLRQEFGVFASDSK